MAEVVKQLIWGLLVEIFLLAVGVATAAWPRRIQRWALAYHEAHPIAARMNIMLPYMRTDYYVYALRITGIFVLLLAVAVPALIIPDLIR